MRDSVHRWLTLAIPGLLEEREEKKRNQALGFAPPGTSGKAQFTSSILGQAASINLQYCLVSAHLYVSIGSGRGDYPYAEDLSGPVFGPGLPETVNVLIFNSSSLQPFLFTEQ